VKRGGGSLSFLVGTISNVLVMEIGWTDVGSGGYILVSTVILVNIKVFLFEIREVFPFEIIEVFLFEIIEVFPV
jgi:hypothetical protein